MHAERPRPTGRRRRRLSAIRRWLTVTVVCRCPLCGRIGVLGFERVGRKWTCSDRAQCAERRTARWGPEV